MASYLPFVNSPFFRTKRKMSGPAASIAASLDKSMSINYGDTLPISIRLSVTKETEKFWDFCKAVDPREIISFILFMLFTVAVLVLGVSIWVTFFKFVVEPDEHHTRATWGSIWLVFSVSVLYFRHFVRARIDPVLRSLGEHAEIFVATSLVMVFAVNIAFYIHVPSATPLPDLGFMFIPEQAVDSKWRPLSDFLTAGVPVVFMLQALFMKRENRVRVMSTFFRCATVCYFLRMLTIALTSLPGPAPHCRIGSTTYYPPQNWIDIVTRVGPMYGNYNSCGDLIFSGHMAYTNSAVLLYLRVLDRHFPRFSGLRWFLGVVYLMILAALCISGRKHYTVDVVLGLMISALAFFHFEHGWIPMCIQYPNGQPIVFDQQRIRPSHAQDLYMHKRFSVDEQAIGEFDDDDDVNESKSLLTPSRPSKRADNVALIC
ncbi:Transmembrane protein, partial [Globisporangium splendens]